MRLLALSNTEVRIFTDAPALSRAAADEFTRAAGDAVSKRGPFTVALAGGSTPKSIYSLLAADEAGSTNGLPWPQIHVFFGDERCVPPDHPDSNFRMASEALLRKVPIPSANIHRIRAELEAPAAAAEYEAELKSFFALRAGEFPRFDLIMLGLGTDGHTASLFPHTAALQVTSRLVCANQVPQLNVRRVTLTFPVLNAAAAVLFVVSGREKAEMLRHILQGDDSGRQYPAQAVRPAPGHLLWMVDEAAASQLAQSFREGEKYQKQEQK